MDTDRGGGATATLPEAQQRKLMHMWPWMTLGSREGPDKRRRYLSFGTDQAIGTLLNGTDRGNTLSLLNLLPFAQRY